MNKLSVFDFKGQDVRIITQDGEPWFVAKDLCEVLEISNPSQALTRLDEEEKNTIILNEGNRGNPSTAVVSESGMYALVLSSRKPEAKPFRKWVTSEVLPSIRKTGSYAIQKTTGDALVEMALAYREQERRLAQVEETVTRHNAELDRISHPDGHYYTILGYANILGIQITSKEANLLGRKAAALSRSRGIPIHDSHDSKYGKINQYLIEILDEVFAQ